MPSPAITPQEFVAKWRGDTRKERSDHQLVVNARQRTRGFGGAALEKSPLITSQIR